MTGGRAPSFRDLSVGETAALSLSKAMRRGQDSPADKSQKRPAREPRNDRKVPMILYQRTRSGQNDTCSLISLETQDSFFSRNDLNASSRSPDGKTIDDLAALYSRLFKTGTSSL